MQKIFFLLILICFSSFLQAQTENCCSKNQCIAYANLLPPSMEGKNDSTGKDFEVFAIQYKKVWFIMMTTANDLAFFIRINKGSTQSLTPMMNISLCMIAKDNQLKLKTKPVFLDGLNLLCYYKPKAKARKLIKNMLKMQNGGKNNYEDNLLDGLESESTRLASTVKGVFATHFKTENQKILSRARQLDQRRLLKAKVEQQKAALLRQLKGSLPTIKIK